MDIKTTAGTLLRDRFNLLTASTTSSDVQFSLLIEQGNIFAVGQSHQQSIASYDKALEIKPNDDQAWNNRGNALGNLGRFEDAIASFDKALEIKPNYDQAWYNKACAYSLCEKQKQAVECLKYAIALNPENRTLAAKDTDFDVIRQNPEFQTLLKA